MARQTRTEYLQELWDRDKDLMEAEIIFRPFQGWFADPMDPRYLGDEGEWLGSNWHDAEDAINTLQRVERINERAHQEYIQRMYSAD